MMVAAKELTLSTPASIAVPERWSHTFLQLCASCPAAAQAKLRGEPSVAPANVRGGGDLHDGIAEYARECWTKGVTQDKETGARIADGYGGAVRTNLLAFVRDARWPWRKLKGADVQECPVEQMWEADLPNGAHFVGRIDLCLVERGAAKENPFADSDDVVKIVDWKQGRPSAWNDTEAPPQLLDYALLYRYQHPEQQDYELMYGAPGWQGKWAFRCWSVGVSELDRHERHLCATIDRYLADEKWEATPGEACAGCFYTAACPLRGTETLAQLTGASPAILAQAAAYHAAMAADAKKQLKAIAEANGGRVDAGGIPWGWNAKTRLQPVMDEEALAEYCQKQGHSLTELLGGFDKDKVKKAIKGGWLPEDAMEEVAAGREFGPIKTTDAGATGEGG